MIDFLRAGDDISFSNNVFGVVSDKNVQVKQRLDLRFKRYYGEFVWNTEKGVDYTGMINGKNPDIEIIDSALKAEAMNESSIVEILSFNSSVTSNRKLIVEATFKIDTGDIINYGVDL